MFWTPNSQETKPFAEPVFIWFLPWSMFVRWILVDCWMFCIIFPGVDISTKSLQLLWVVWKFGIVENHYNINQQPKAPKQHLTANHWMIIYPVSLWPRAEWFAPKSCFLHRLHPQAESWQETVEQVGWHTFRRVARVDFSGPCARYSIERTYYSLWLCCLARMKGVAREHIRCQKPRFKNRRWMKKNGACRWIWCFWCVEFGLVTCRWVAAWISWL